MSPDFDEDTMIFNISLHVRAQLCKVLVGFVPVLTSVHSG